MALKLANIGDPRITSVQFQSVLQETSAFLRLTRNANLGISTGSREIYLEATDATIVAEGARKPQDGLKATYLDLFPRKFVTPNILTRELFDTMDAAGKTALSVSAASKIARKVDETIAGSETVTGFTSLGNTTGAAVEIKTRGDFLRALTATNGSRLQLAISTVALAELRSAVAADGNTSVFRIELAADLMSGTIENVPFVAFESDENVGYISEWTRTTAGGQAGNVKREVQYTGTWYDTNLNETNSVNVLFEAFVGFVARPNIADQKKFITKFTVPAPVVDPEA